MKKLSEFTFLILLTGCTTIGFHQTDIRNKMDFGVGREIKVCTIPESSIDLDDIDDLFNFWNKELSLYAIKAIPIKFNKIERPGFTGGDILNYLFSLKLTEDCDRILYLKGRTWGDLIYEFFTLGIFAGVGLKLEVQGGVESLTNSRGYIKGKYISTLQLLFTSPKSTLVHEGYHLLGCGHQLFMEDCYKQILILKKMAEHPNLEKGFFPSLTPTGYKYFDRKEINAKLGIENN